MTGLTDGGHGGAEEAFEVVGGSGIFGDGGFDGFLGDGAGVAEVDKGGEGIVAGGAVMRASRGGGDGDGEVVELVFELEDNSLGGLFADAWDAGEGGVVAGADGGDQAAAVDAAEDGDGQLWADAGDGEELFEETLLLSFGEAEERDLVFTDVGVDVQSRFCAFVGKSGEGSDADGDVVAHTSTLEDGLIGSFCEEASAEVSDHASGDCSVLGAPLRQDEGCIKMCPMRTSFLVRLAGVCLPMMSWLAVCSSACAQERSEPGKFDFYLMNLSWGPEFCSVPGAGPECKATRGFVLHGLWPQNYDGSYPVNCAERPGPLQPERNLDITPDLPLLEHEWSKHGTCTTMSPEEFFGLERQAFHSVRIPKKLRKLKHEEPMRPKDIVDLFAKANPSFPQESVVVSCADHRLTAVEVCLAKDGLMPISCQGLRECDADAFRVVAPPLK